MHRIVNPQQTRLFDPYDSVLTEKAPRRLPNGWPGVFRHVILELMPVDTLREHFDPAMGRPTKDLYSVAGFPSTRRPATVVHLAGFGVVRSVYIRYKSGYANSCG